MNFGTNVMKQSRRVLLAFGLTALALTFGAGVVYPVLSEGRGERPKSEP